MHLHPQFLYLVLVLLLLMRLRVVIPHQASSDRD